MTGGKPNAHYVACGSSADLPLHGCGLRHLEPYGTDGRLTAAGSGVGLHAYSVVGRARIVWNTYSCCRVLLTFARDRLGLRFRYGWPLSDMLLVAPQHHDAEQDPHWWHRVAILLYAANRAANALRTTGGGGGAMDAARLLQHALAEAVRGCARLEAAVYGRR